MTESVVTTGLIVDLVRSAISRADAISLVEGYVRVRAAEAATDATEKSFGRVINLLDKKRASNADSKPDEAA
jgi:hypothetical protein